MGTYSGVNLTYIVPLYFSTNNSEGINKLIGTYQCYPKEIMDKVQFLFVDDCSPIPVSLPKSNLNIRLLRIEEDIRWNQPGARNLGAVFAKSDKLLMTDQDHIIPEKTFKYILHRNIGYDRVHLFRRVDLQGKKIRSHANTFIISRATFLKYFGYDEDFCGNYGYDDTFLFHWMKLNKVKVRKTSIRYPIISNTDCKEAHNLQRDTSINKELLEFKIKQGYLGHSRKFLNFKWKKETYEN